MYVQTRSTVAEEVKRPQVWRRRRNMTVTAAAPSRKLSSGATTVKPSPVIRMTAPARNG